MITAQNYFLNVFIASSSLVALVFFFFEHFQKNESEIARNKLEQFWTSFNISSWYEIPFSGLKSFLKIKDIPLRVESILSVIGDVLSKKVIFILLVNVPFTLLIYLCLNKIDSPFLNSTINILLTDGVYFILGCLIIYLIFYKLSDVLDFEIINIIGVVSILGFLLPLIILVLFAPIATLLILSQNIFYFFGLFEVGAVELQITTDFLVILGLTIAQIIPIFYIIKIFRSIIDNSSTDYIAQILVSYILSFGITLLAVLIGFINNKQLTTDLPFQLIVSNFIFDIITIVITFKLISIITNEGKLNFLLPIIALDIFLAGIFACCSLYFGVLGTSYQLSIIEVFQIGFSPFISETDINVKSKFFFPLMHTSFIPTVLYFFLILTAYISKFILKFSEYMFIPRDSIKRPYGLFRTLFLIFAGIGALIKVI